MARGEKMTSKNVNSKFEHRVNRAAAAIMALSKCKRWEKEFGLPKDSVSKAFDHLAKAIEQARSGERGGFKL